MLHVTCDLCGKEMCPGEDARYVVKIEVRAGHASELTDDDLNEDHLDAVSTLLDDEVDSMLDDDAVSQRMRFDLCPACRTRFVRDPLSREAVMHLDFSQN